VIEIPKQKELCSMTGKLVQISDFQDVGWQDLQSNLGSEPWWEPGISHIHKVHTFVMDEGRERNLKNSAGYRNFETQLQD
jgi:hypothetical protein